MDIEVYLQRVLSEFPIERIYCRAGIELQRLTDDGIIERADCRYSRDSEGNRVGVAIVYQETKSDVENYTKKEILIYADAR